MMNMQNLGSKEKLGVKFNDGISAELCLKLWFELDLQSFYLQGFHGYLKGCPATSWTCLLILLLKITLKMPSIFLNHW